MSLRSVVTLLVVTASLASAASAAPAPAGSTPPGSVSGTASFADQRLKLTHGIAWWSAEDKMTNVALFDHVPPAGILAQLRQGFAGEGAPVGHLTLEIKPGAPLSPASVGYCFVQFDFPKDGPLGSNGDGKACGISEISGDPRPGGTLALRLKGQAGGPGGKPFAWDLQVNLTIAP